MQGWGPVGLQVHPEKLTQAFMAAATEAGAQLLTGCVTGLQQDPMDGRVKGGWGPWVWARVRGGGGGGRTRHRVGGTWRAQGEGEGEW
jgi:hypothetical protein